MFLESGMGSVDWGAQPPWLQFVAPPRGEPGRGRFNLRWAVRARRVNREGAVHCARGGRAPQSSDDFEDDAEAAEGVAA